ESGAWTTADAVSGSIVAPAPELPASAPTNSASATGGVAVARTKSGSQPPPPPPARPKGATQPPPPPPGRAKGSSQPPPIPPKAAIDVEGEATIPESTFRAEDSNRMVPVGEFDDGSSTSIEPDKLRIAHGQATIKRDAASAMLGITEPALTQVKETPVELLLD